MSDIKLYKLDGNNVASPINGGQITLERHLQNILENNMMTMLGISFLASEYSTGQNHRGRIDSLGLDENFSPVIIEYKRSSHENVINQGLFYLDWLMDHKAEFQLLVQNKFDKETADKIDWSAPRLLCIAADFTRYDEHAVKQMNRNIELLRYRKYGDDLILLELVNATTELSSADLSSNNSTVTTYKTITNVFDELSGEFAVLVKEVQSYLLDLADDVQVKTLKYYEAYKRIKNFACLEVRPSKGKIILYLKLNPESVDLQDGFSRDVSNIGHFGTGELEVTITDAESFEKAKPLIMRSYEES